MSSDEFLDEFCDFCNNKLNMYRTYYNGRKICPTCYGKEINENILKKVIIECPKCGYKQESKNEK